jgi:hypothetical protein
MRHLRIRVFVPSIQHSAGEYCSAQCICSLARVVRYIAPSCSAITGIVQSSAVNRHVFSCLSCLWQLVTLIPWSHCAKETGNTTCSTHPDLPREPSCPLILLCTSHTRSSGRQQCRHSAAAQRHELSDPTGSNNVHQTCRGTNSGCMCDAPFNSG